MSSTDDPTRFDKWYSRMKGLVMTGEEPEEQKGEDLESCVRQLKQDGHAEERAYAICNASVKADLTEAGREEALEIAKSVTGDDDELGDVFGRVVEAAGLDVDAKEEETVEELVREFLEDWEGTDGSEPNISDLQEWVGATDRTELEAAVDLAGLIDAYQEANPDVDLGEATVGELIEWTETQGADQKAEFGADVYRVLADPDDDTEYNGDLLGIAVDFPESDVYVDWRREAFPDQLDHPHVSIYGSVEDLEQATGNVLEAAETVEAAKADVDAKAEPETRRVYLDHGVSTAPDDAVVRSDQKGLYYEAPVDGDE